MRRFAHSFSTAGPALHAPLGCPAGADWTAALDARAAMARLKAERTARGEETLSFGIAQHAGDVVYGNIGAANHLDLTVVGPAVNLTSRLERLCRSLGLDLLISDTFAGMCACATIARSARTSSRGSPATSRFSTVAA